MVAKSDDKSFDALKEELDELRRQAGENKPFPRIGGGGYMSHFRIVIELETGQVVSIVSPMAAQSVAWSEPFIFTGEDDAAKLVLPDGSDLPSEIRYSDFIEKPEGFFERGKETVWLQILNLDARMESDIGPIRIILGETLLRSKYASIFKPSLGAAQSLGKRGFPAKLFFNPLAIIETPMGAFRAVHGVLSYGRVTDFPPIGTPVTIRKCIPLDRFEDIENSDPNVRPTAKPLAKIRALTHPIDMELQFDPDEEKLADRPHGGNAYSFVEYLIRKGEKSPPAT